VYIILNAGPVERRSRAFLSLVLLSGLVLTAACKRDLGSQAGAAVKTAPIDCIIPRPSSVVASEGKFVLQPGTAILVNGEDAEVRNVAEYLASRLRPATGFAFEVRPAAGAVANGHIQVGTISGDSMLGEEGYELKVSAEQVLLSAWKAEGLFRGVQTLRQLLPAAIEKPTVQTGQWEIQAGKVQDRPRFAWRGAMLDVSRHFFGVADVKRYIDEIAYYKLNRLHLHLSDDQGWRVEIRSWPKLATLGGSTQVGGGPGGYFSQADYSDIVAYAGSRYITIIPEIDMPGHTNAALASYPELNCSGKAPALYTGIEVGFSSLCADKELTYKFVDDVVRELAALTPGPYIHVGGDEASSTPEPAYKKFMTRVQKIVQDRGKQMIGWGEVAKMDGLSPQSLVQHWTDDANLPRLAAEAGAKVIMSPATRVYLDMKYTPSTALGQDWAARVEVRDGYTWDPATFISGVGEDQIIGVETPIWTETLATFSDLEYMAFPRLPGTAEIGWSAAAGRDWDEYRERLATHGARLAAMGVNFYRSPQVPWPDSVAYK